MRYRTKWTGHIKDKASGVIKSIYNMIDFILIPEFCCPLLKRARSYAGTEVHSDYKLVLDDMEVTSLYRV